MLQKNKRVKLYGQKLKKLNQNIFERDNHRCIVCGKYVDDSHKFHHEPCGQDKTDEMSGGVVLCDSCHQLRHDSGRLKEIKVRCEEYLRSLYG